jgi:hypothetical protein
MALELFQGQDLAAFDAHAVGQWAVGCSPHMKVKGQGWTDPVQH